MLQNNVNLLNVSNHTIYSGKTLNGLTMHYNFYCKTSFFLQVKTMHYSVIYSENQ